MEPYLRHTRIIDGKRVTVYAHREVWEAAYGPIPEGFIVDHINGNTRDNSLENLRLVTTSQNGMNRGPNKNNTTGMKGLTWNAVKSRWLCQVSSGGERRTFRTSCLLTAAAWIHRTREELHGDYSFERRSQ